MIPGKKFNPATETSRRPTPEKFAHLRKWLDVDTKYIDITNITELIDINMQLEQSAKLYVSNVISRVIAQLIGKYGDGFVTLEATADGELKVDVKDKSPTILQAAISFAGAVHNQIIALVTGKKIKITTLFLTVAGEVNLTLESHETGISGAMDFGAADEPRGIVVNFGDSPMETVAGEAFKILASTGVQVSGYCNYYTE